MVKLFFPRIILLFGLDADAKRLHFHLQSILHHEEAEYELFSVEVTRNSTLTKARESE